LDTAGTPGGAVNVLERQCIGPFDVTRLAANDPTALATWLADKGFPHPDGLDANLAPYVADHWEIVAIQLAAAQAGESLTGELQPLRLSRSATTPQAVNLYVLADHRMDPESVLVAGLGDGAFLTQWNDYIYQPELIDGDYGDITGLILLAVLASCAVVLIVVLARRRRRKA
jgi:hypothetical protein